jgi:hypothetical protein
VSHLGNYLEASARAAKAEARAERLEKLLREARPYLATGNMFRQDEDESDLCHRIDAALGVSPC